MSKRARQSFKRDVTTRKDAGDQQCSKRSRQSDSAHSSEDVLAPPGLSDDTAGAQDVTDYELQRQQLIARNKARLEALQLPQLAAEVVAEAAHAKAAKPHRSARAEKKPRPPRAVTEPPDRRTSLRLRGVGPDGSTAAGVDKELRNGVVTLASGAGSIWGPHAAGGAAAAAASAPQRSALQGPVPFASAGGDVAADAAFLAMLRAAASAAPESGAPAPMPASCAAALAKLQLQPGDVAKLVKDAVTCMAFCPSASRPLLAAADKAGHLALWDVDWSGPGTGDAGDCEGILTFAPHGDYVSGLKWSAGARLFTCSYDGTLRIQDPEAGAFLQLQVAGLEGEMDEFSALEVTADGATVFVASPEGEGSVIDTRAAALAARSVPFGTRKVNSLALEPSTGYLLAAASTDGLVSIFDTRRLAPAGGSSGTPGKRLSGAHAKALAVCKHAKSSQGAAWAPDGSGRLLSISFDDTLRVWAPAPPGGGAASATSWVQRLLAKHNNNTGRWVTPFRPAWAPAADAFVVGSMKRAVDVFDAASGKLLGSLASEHMTAIPSRFAFCGGQTPLLLAAATSSGRVHIYR